MFLWRRVVVISLLGYIANTDEIDLSNRYFTLSCSPKSSQNSTKIVKIVNKSGVHQLLGQEINTVQIHRILFNSEKQWYPVIYYDMNGIRHYY